MVLAHTMVLAPNHGASSRAAAISAPRLPAPTAKTSSSSERDRWATPPNLPGGCWLRGTDGSDHLGGLSARCEQRLELDEDVVEQLARIRDEPAVDAQPDRQRARVAEDRDPQPELPGRRPPPDRAAQRCPGERDG